MDLPCGGIVIDWGGVLTSPLTEAIEGWIDEEGLDPEHYYRVMWSWIGASYGADGPAGPVHALERGEVSPEEFEQRLAAELRMADGSEVAAEGLLSRMFSGFTPVEEMYHLVRRARRQGVRTCLLSNSWGNGYPRHLFADTFDAIVISGEVGMRKPEPEIFAHATELLGLPAEECVFVDDVEHNIKAARALGMRTILHRDPEQTRARLEEACGIRLATAGESRVAPR